MKKEEMIEELETMLAQMGKTLELSGLEPLTLPEEVETHKYEIVKKAYTWAKALYKNQYQDWLKVWVEEPEHIWLKRKALGGFREVKVLMNLTHLVRAELMRRSSKPQLLRKGYQRQHVIRKQKQQAKNHCA